MTAFPSISTHPPTHPNPTGTYTKTWQAMQRGQYTHPFPLALAPLSLKWPAKEEEEQEEEEEEDDDIRPMLLRKKRRSDHV